MQHNNMDNRANFIPKHTHANIIIWLMLGLVIIGGAVGIGLWQYGVFEQEVKSTANIYEVQSGAMSIEVNETGVIDARENAIVRSQLPGRFMITWLIPEGTEVKAGDKLVELDRSKLDSDLREQANRRDSAEANFIAAEEELTITKSQTASDIEQAELDLKLAKLDLKKYVEGEHPRDIQKVNSDITLAEEELTRAIDKEAWSKKLSEKGHISASDLQADELSRKRAEITLGLAKTEKDLLMNYTHERRLAELNNRVSQAVQALERVRSKANADINKATANLKNKKADHQRQIERFKEIEFHLTLTIIRAPVDGVAIHATSRKNRYSNAEPLEAGQEVRQRQELIRIPTNNEMMVVAKVPEAQLPKVARGMPVAITVDAVPGQQFTGMVGKIAPQPDPTGWWNNNLKLYSVEIYLDGSANELLRTGMNCRVSIQTAYYEDVLYVPLQCVIGIDTQPTVYRLDDTDTPMPVMVEIGLDNDRQVHVISGLNNGDRLMLNPPLQDSEVKPGKEIQVRPAIKRPEGSETVSKEETTQAKLSEDSLRGMQMLKGVSERGYLANLKFSDEDKKRIKDWIKAFDEQKYDQIDEVHLKRIVNTMRQQFKKMREQKNSQ